jgi:gliding motility-associated-like protein
MRPITFLLSLFLCAFSLNKAHADAVFTIAPTSTNAAVGTLVTFTVTVNGFVDLNGFQFPIEYDETKLQFVSGTAAPLSASPSDTAQWLNFTSTTMPTNKWIRANYFFFDISGGPTGRTIPNGTAILTLRFNKIATGTTDIQFSPTLQPTIQVIDESDALFIVNQGPHGFTATATPPAAPSNLSFILEKDTITAAGGNTCLTVRTKSFTNMVDFQFGITYDTTKLVVPPTIQTGTALGTDLLVVNPPLARNQIRAIFTAPTTTNGTAIPATLADSTVLFSVCLTAKPGASGPAAVTFSEFMTPTIFTNSFSNTAGPITNAVLTNGSVQINAVAGPAPTPFRLTVEKDSAMVSQSVCVDVRAFGWTNMVAATSGIAYDTTKLTFNNVMYGANPLNNPADFQVIHLAASKQIRISYTAPTQTNGNPVPSTLADSIAIFQICFTVKASAQSGDVAPVAFATFQTPTVLTEEFANTTGNITSYTLQSGSVKVIGASGNPCSTANLLIPTGTITQNNVSCFGGNNGSTNINPTGGTAPLVVTWTGPGATPPGPGKSIMGLVAGAYTPTVTDANGCSIIGSAIAITQPLTAVDIVVNSSANPTCFNGTNGGIQATTTGGTTPYAWNWRNISSQQVATTEDVTNLGAGNYSVTVTDANGCTDWVTGTIITQPSALSIGANPGIVGVTCPGGSDGFLSITATGGTGTKTYVWSPASGTTNQLQNVQAGSYRVTVSDANGCQVTGGPFVVPGVTPISIGAPMVTPVSCAGTSNGAITIAVSGGNGGNTVLWNPGGLTGTTISNLAAGTYTPTVTDNKGCTATIPGIAVNGQLALTATSVVANANCAGSATGSIALTISGGNAGATVTWAPGGLTGATVSNLAAGTYTPTITAGAGCSITLPGIVVTAPAAITGVATVSNITCANAGNGSISLVVSGGNGGNQVTWVPGGLQGTTISNLGAGTYTPTVTDSQGCTAALTGSVVTAPPALEITNAVVTPQTTLTPANGAINITVAGGSGNKTFSWAGPNGAQAVTEDLSGITAGAYALTVTDANNCNTTGTYTVLNNSASATVVSVANSCGFIGGCVTIATVGLTFPYIVTYDNTTSTANTDPFTVCGVQSGTKTFTITGANGLTVTATATVNNGLPAIVDATVTNVSPDNQGGSVILVPNSNAPGVYNYAWANGSTKDTLLNLDAATYCVTITNTASGCKDTNCYVVNYPPVIQLPATSLSPTCGQTNGTITLNFSGGNGPIYRYVIKNQDNVVVLDSTTTLKLVKATGLGAGTYTATVFDETPTEYPWPGTIVLSTTGVEATQAIVSDYQGFGVSSPDKCDGAVTITPTVGTAPYLFNWSTGMGVNTATNNVLCDGAYTVTITDATNCTTVLTGNLTAPTSVVATASAQSQHNGFNVTCKGSCNGIGRVVAVGGIAPYKVKWSTGATGDLTDNTDLHDVFSLCAGLYTVTVTDAVGTAVISTVTITEPAPLELSFTQIPPARFTASDGIVIAQANGAAGTVAYTYTIAGGGSGTGPKAENLRVGNIVTFLATDANNCTAVGRDTVPYPTDGCLEMSPVITPNQDDKNDAFLITCIEATLENRVEIFNRYGQLVFDTQSYDNTSNRWEGLNSRNQALPEGVYFVVLTYKNDLGEGFVKKTYVNLIRS